MPRSSLKGRRKFCLPSCFSSPSVWDPDDLEFRRDDLPLAYLTRLRSLSRTVPLAEIAGAGGEGGVDGRGAAQSGGAPALLSPAGNREKELGHGFRKDEKKAVPHVPSTPPSCRAHNQSPIFCHVSAKLNSRTQPPSPLNHAGDPAQPACRRTDPVKPQPSRPAGPAPSPTRSSRRHSAVTGFLILSATLTVMLFFGRLCAVLCNCAWLYLLSCFPPAASPAAAATATEIDVAAEVDVSSPEYKKKVVLMGFLERSRYGVSGMPTTPLASPATARLR